MLFKLFKEVAEELNIDYYVVEHVIKYIFAQIRTNINNLTSKDILIHYFGTFKIKRHNLKKYIEQLEKSYAKGDLDVKKFRKHKETIEKLKQISNE